MTPEAQRIAIAQACGVIRLVTIAETVPAMIEWMEEEPHPHAQVTRPPWCEILKGNKIPNYPKDLNACHEMEKELGYDQHQKYQRILGRITGVGHPIYATASERSEAFLRTIGKWRDE